MFMQNTYTTEMKEQYIEEYRNSELSVQAFAKQKGIPSSTFRGWLDRETEIRFGALNTEEETTKVASQRPCIVFINDKIRIELKPDYDKEMLKSIVEVLMTSD